MRGAKEPASILRSNAACTAAIRAHFSSIGFEQSQTSSTVCSVRDSSYPKAKHALAPSILGSAVWPWGTWSLITRQESTGPVLRLAWFVQFAGRLYSTMVEWDEAKHELRCDKEGLAATITIGSGSSEDPA